MPSCFQPSASCQDFRSFTVEESAVIDALNQQLGHAPQWQQMIHNGSSNTLLTTELYSRSVVLRINAPSQLAFGVNRSREAKVLQLIQPYCWAPTVLLSDEQFRWCLMVNHGQPPAQDLVPELIDQLLGAARQWQKIVSGPPINYNDLYQSYRNVFREIGDWQAISLVDLIEQRQSLLPQLKDCLTHHDLHPGNLCLNEQRLTVLDWEYAGIGNPWFDIAALQRFFPVSVADLKRLPVIQGLSESEFEQGLIQAVWIAEALDVLWYRVRGEDGVDNKVQLFLDSVQAG